MISKIPPKRRDGKSSFLKLVAYVSVRDDIPLSQELKEDQRFKRPFRSREAIFERLIEYSTRSDKDSVSEIVGMSDDGDIRVSVNGVVSQTNLMSIETAGSEMNSLAKQNRRVQDPVYHYILSWREGENPSHDQIFDSVKYTLKKLNMEGHQYVASIHYDTDNVHVHVAANRVNPVSLRATNMYNDADRLQRCCRVLEKKHNFQVDNGSWVRNKDQEIVRAAKGFKKAPAGAASLEHFSDRESIFTYAVSHNRNPINAMFRDGSVTWDRLHEQLNKSGLVLERKGEGMVVRDVTNPDSVGIRASRLHTAMTLSQLEKRIGEFTPGPRSETDVLQSMTVPGYTERLHVRDRGARAERRLARADARDDLRARYQEYKHSWKKPSLRSPERFREIAEVFRAQKVRVRSEHSDPHLRKLMYHVVEFEREKAMAALRIQLKAEKKELTDSGKMRPMPYRAWTEQQALRGDTAAISQLRGWAYREGRKHRTAVKSDTLILCAPADDIRLLKADGFNVRVNRDGAAIYSRNGRDAIVDRGDSLEVRDAYLQGNFNTRVAIDMASWKSGERIKFTDDGEFPLAAGEAAAAHNLRFRDNPVVPTDRKQYDYTAAVYERERMQLQMQRNQDTTAIPRDVEQRYDDVSRPRSNKQPKY